MIPAAPTAGLGSFLHDVLERELPVDATLAGLAVAMLGRTRVGLDREQAGALLDGSIDAVSASDLPAVPDDAGPAWLGDVLEAMRDRDDRRRRGAFFTPHATAALVVDRATDGWTWPSRPSVCDPACGGGAFLLAAAHRLETRGHNRRDVVADLVWGADRDALSAATSTAALALWCVAGDVAFRGHRVVHADSLVTGLAAWPRDDGFDLVVSNPPFQNQLATRTARTRVDAEQLAARFGDLSRGYADSATLFLVAASQTTRSGGRFSLLLPESFLAARDATVARQTVAADATLVGLWLPGTQLFSASVRVCVPVFEAGADASSTIRRWRGVDAEAAGSLPTTAGRALATQTTWAPLAADLRGVPDAELRVDTVVGTRARATAGFRDQFYGVRPFVRGLDPEEAALPKSSVRLVTSGAIDLVCDRWSRLAVKFAGSRYQRPIVDLSALGAADPSLARWADQVLVPKLVVATQTRVVELLVDEAGAVWPSVPTIAVIAPPEQLWSLASALASPPVSAECLRRHAGTALSGDAIKLSAKQVLEVPLPADPAAWGRGTQHLQAASHAASRGDATMWRAELELFGRSMCVAYGVGSDVCDWWLDRVPAYR